MSLEVLKVKRAQLIQELEWVEDEIKRMHSGVDVLGKPKSLSEEEAAFEGRKKARAESMRAMNDDRLWKGVVKALDDKDAEEAAKEVNDD